MHVLVTGHTGFKGSWLTLMLTELGHEVSGLALDPVPGSLFEQARLHSLLTHDYRVDVRDAAAVRHAVTTAEPDALMHLAAQPLVRESYADPRWTIETNVMGTLNVLEAVQSTPSIHGQVIITTDKVYRNVNQIAGYVESDALGGHDPYSASKAMADLLTQSWIDSFHPCPTAVARAGNVIGGGDTSKDRLLPDLMRAFADGRTATIRYPDAVRPWQHVLDCLNGYLLLLDRVVNGHASGQWNFGPGPESFVTVGTLADLAARLWGPEAAWTAPPGHHPHEAELLALDASKARQELGWDDKLDFEAAVAWTVAWERAVLDGTDAQNACLSQLREFREMGTR